MAYELQKPFKKQLDQLQKMDIITPLGVDKTAEWCNSFVLVPKANGKVRLCLDPVRLNQALIRPIHRGPTFNGILSKLNNVPILACTCISPTFWSMFQCKIDKIFSDMLNVFGIVMAF